LKNLESFSSAKKGATALIIDLRDNGGGYMEAIAIADELLKDKQLIVFTKQ
jgi:carboxyl-terminal processing protease